MYQQIQIIGRLGKDPESRFTPAGQKVTSFSVATDNQYTNQAGDKVKETTWFRVQVWGKMADACETYLAKGSMVLVAGRLISDKATGGPKIFVKQDQSSGASFEINASVVKFLSTNTAKTEQAETPFDGQSTADVGDGENLPF
jgi:single-strand DNA-binding protein